MATPIIADANEAKIVAQLLASGQLQGPAAERATAALVAFDQTSGDRYTAGRRADVEARRGAQRSAASAALTGLADVPPRLVESGQQLATGVGELAGVLPEGSVARQTADMNLRRQQAVDWDPRAEQAADVGETAALLIPGVSMGRQAIQKALIARGMLQAGRTPETFWAAYKAGAWAGGTAAALGQPATETAETPGDVLAPRAIGLGLGSQIGGAVTGLAGAKTAIANFAGRMRANAEQNEETARLLKSGRAFLDRGQAEPIVFTTSQQTGSAVAKRFEQQMAATRAQNYFNSQLERFAQQSDSMAIAFERAAGGQKSGLETAFRVSEAWNKQAAQMQQAASTLYGSRLANVLADAAADGAKFPIPFNHVEKVTGRWASETGAPWWRKLHPGGNQWGPEFKELSDYLEQIRVRNVALNNPAGMQTGRIGEVSEGLSIEELVRMRRAINNADKAYYKNRGNPEFIKDAAAQDLHRSMREMRDAIDGDIDAFLATNPADRPAVQALKELRSANRDYADFTKVRDQIGQTAAAQMFGFRLSENPAESLRQIAKMEPAQQQYLVQALKQADPAALVDMRAFLIRDAVDRLPQQMGPAVAGQFNPVAYVRSILDEQGQVFGKALFSTQERAILQESVDAVRILFNGIARDGGPGIAFQAEGATMALKSGSDAFLIRQAYRLMGRAGLERMLLTKEGLKALDTAASTVKARPQEAQRALVKLAAALGVPEDELWMED